jgi:hypothetical protein
MFHFPSTRKNILAFLLVLVVLLPIYFSTLQTIPNGSENYYMIDVGETQIVLNTWGTLHATGYPLYVMIGNVLVFGMRLLGISPAAAPGIVSMLCGILALALIYMLALQVIKRPLVAAGVTILFGLTRTVWIHNAIAEIYSFGLVFLALLLLIGLWESTPPPDPLPAPTGFPAVTSDEGGKSRDKYWRIYLLALIGGFGVFHHRALLMVAPALLYVVWPQLITFVFPPSNRSRLQKILSTLYSVLSTLFLGLVGFLPYLYLPLRAATGAAWVYGEPGTWDGFWDQFLGREASRFIGPPQSFEALVSNFNRVNTVLVTDLTLPGIILGLFGLLLALHSPPHKRAAMALLLSGGVAYIFHILLYSDILSALILPVTLSLALGWLYVAVATSTALTLKMRLASQSLKLIPHASYLIPAFILGLVLFSQNHPFIKELTSNPTGLETIALARGTPRGSTLMLDWGPRHFAVGFARDVLGELPYVRLVDHKADFKVIAASERLVTPDFTFYNRPVSWWQEQLDTPVYLSAAAPHLVEIKTYRDMSPVPLEQPIAAIEQQIICTHDSLQLWVGWGAAGQPDHDMSVFVHLLDESGTMIAQADQSAPVYGWRPLTTWEAGEIVRDVYPLPRLDTGVTISYGLYRQLETGEFQNEVVYELPVECGN